MKNGNWARLLAYVTGLVNQQLLLQNEYLVAENRILRGHLPTRLRLSDQQRSTLAEIGKRLGRRGSGTGRLRGETGYDTCLVPDSSPGNSMVPNNARIQAGRLFNRKSSN